MTGPILRVELAAGTEWLEMPMSGMFLSTAASSLLDRMAVGAVIDFSVMSVGRWFCLGFKLYS